MSKYEISILLFQTALWGASCFAILLSAKYGGDIMHMIIGGRFITPELEDITDWMQRHLFGVILQIIALIGMAWYAYQKLPEHSWSW
jgi:hypothetical protein